MEVRFEHVINIGLFLIQRLNFDVKIFYNY